MSNVLSDKGWLLKLASLLEGGGLEGGNIQLAEEFARMLARRLRAIADKMGTDRAKEWIRTQPEVKYNLEGEETDDKAD